MPGLPFEVSVRNADGSTVVDFSGDISREAAERFDRLTMNLSGEQNPLILNFSDVDYINSSGIALIVGLLAKARSDMRDVSVFGLTDHYREIFEITRLSDFMDIYENETAALSASH